MTFKITGPGLYRTRDGRKAEVVGRKTFNQSFPWLGAFDTGAAATWNDEGRWDEYGEHHFDLIAPWTEPAKGEFWTNVFTSKDGAKWQVTGRSWTSKRDADENAVYVESQGLYRRIACVRAQWVEGEGL